MIQIFLYLLLIFFELIFFFLLASYTVSLLFSSMMGSPYVPTKGQEINDILKAAGLKKNQIFIELGSGDGRVVIEAVRQYGVWGIGVEVNPFLLTFAKIKSRWYKLRNIKFIKENIFKTSLNMADIIYVFLMPNLLEKIKTRLKRECKMGTLLISHGFKIENFGKDLIQTIDHQPFPTYFYRL